MHPNKSDKHLHNDIKKKTKKRADGWRREFQIQMREMKRNRCHPSTTTLCTVHVRGQRPGKAASAVTQSSGAYPSLAGWLGSNHRSPTGPEWKDGRQAVKKTMLSLWRLMAWIRECFTRRRVLRWVEQKTKQKKENLWWPAVCCCVLCFPRDGHLMRENGHGSMSEGMWNICVRCHLHRSGTRFIELSDDWMFNTPACMPMLHYRVRLKWVLEVYSGTLIKKKKKCSTHLFSLEHPLIYMYATEKTHRERIIHICKSYLVLVMPR